LRFNAVQILVLWYMTPSSLVAETKVFIRTRRDRVQRVRR